MSSTNRTLLFLFVFITVATIAATVVVGLLEAPAWTIYIAWAGISLVAGITLARLPQSQR